MSAEAAPPLTLVVGPGGVGGYLAAVLAAGGTDVAVVARGANAAAIRSRGLQLEDPQRAGLAAQRVPVFDTIAGAPPAATVVLAVKQRDLEGVIAGLPSYLDRCPPDSVVVALQNGVAHLDGQLHTAARDRLIVGAVYIFSEVSKPGTIRVIGGPRSFRLGPAGDADGLMAEVEAIVAAWAGAGVATTAEVDGPRVAWEKLCVIAALAGLTSVTERTVGELREIVEVLETVRALVDELSAIAAAEGVAVTPGLAEWAVAALRLTDAAGRSSLWLDLSQGRDSELEVLLGDPLRRAQRHGVAVPVLRALYGLIRARYGIAVPHLVTA